jgi:hypothetical protein
MLKKIFFPTTQILFSFIISFLITPHFYSQLVLADDSASSSNSCVELATIEKNLLILEGDCSVAKESLQQSTKSYRVIKRQLVRHKNHSKKSTRIRKNLKKVSSLIKRKEIAKLSICRGSDKYRESLLRLVDACSPIAEPGLTPLPIPTPLPTPVFTYPPIATPAPTIDIGLPELKDTTRYIKIYAEDTDTLNGIGWREIVVKLKNGETIQTKIAAGNYYWPENDTGALTVPTGDAEVVSGDSRYAIDGNSNTAFVSLIPGENPRKAWRVLDLGRFIKNQDLGSVELQVLNNSSTRKIDIKVGKDLKNFTTVGSYNKPIGNKEWLKYTFSDNSFVSSVPPEIVGDFVEYFKIRVAESDPANFIGFINISVIDKSGKRVDLPNIGTSGECPIMLNPNDIASKYDVKNVQCSVDNILDGDPTTASIAQNNVWSNSGGLYTFGMYRARAIKDLSHISFEILGESKTRTLTLEATVNGNGFTTLGSYNKPFTNKQVIKYDFNTGVFE